MVANIVSAQTSSVSLGSDSAAIKNIEALKKAMEIMRNSSVLGVMVLMLVSQSNIHL